MKKTLKYTTLAALAAFAAGAIPAYAETLSLDYTKTSSGSSQDITVPSIYTPEVTGITASDDLDLKYTVEGGTVFNTTKNFTVNDVTVSATTSGKVWGHEFLRIGQDTTTTFNSLNYTLNAWGENPATTIYLNEGSTFTVNKNIIYKAAAAQNEINFFFMGTANSTLNVGGKIELLAPEKTTTNLNLQFNSYNVNIGGVIKLNNDAYMKRIQLDNGATDGTARTYNRSFGGLSVNKNGQLRIVGKANNTVNLTFTNSTEESYSGYLMTKADSTGNKFNITMNAATAAGKQTLRFADVPTETKFDGANYNNAAIDTVSVSNGTLSLGMNSKMSANKLIVNGEKAVFDITSADGTSEIGRATFGSFEGTKGAIAFDIAESNDFLDITGTANVSSDFAFIVNMTKADFDSFLGEGETSLQYNIISFTTEGSSFDATTVICSDSQLKGKIDLVDIAGTTSVMLTIAAVPEPATVAAILGAVVLAFAAYRRRK